MLRQRRGSRDLAIEVCTSHESHHRVKRVGVVPGGENSKVVRGGCPAVCRSPMGGWRDRSWWPGVHQSEPDRRQRCVLCLCVFPCRRRGLPLFRRVLCLLRKSHVCVRVPRLEVALASDSRPDFFPPSSPAGRLSMLLPFQPEHCAQEWPARVGALAEVVRGRVVVVSGMATWSGRC